MNFSLLCPTRERIDSVDRLLKSIDYTCQDRASVEIHFAIDEDDVKTTQGMIRLTQNYPKLNVQTHRRQRSDFINKDYYNWLVPFTKGKFLFVIGDDCVFTNNGWDVVAIKKLEEYLANKPDRIVYVMINDGTPPPKDSEKTFCCFPMVSREAYNGLGFVLHGEIPTWGADVTLHEVYSNPKVNRVFQLPEVAVQHISHHCGPEVKRDGISYNVEKSFRKYGCGLPITKVKTAIPNDIAKLEVLIHGN